MSSVRTHFWRLVARLNGGFCWPRKYGLNGTMPALTSSSVGSSATRLAEGTTVCPFSSKKRRKRRAISADSISAAILHVVVSAGTGCVNLVEPEPGSQLAFPDRRMVAHLVGEVPEPVGESHRAVHRTPRHMVGPQ